MKKDELRAIYLEKRNEISEIEAYELTREINEHVFENFSFRGKTVSIFLTMTQKKELDTSLILHQLLEENCRVTVSKSDFSTSEMTHYLYEGGEQIQMSPIGIPEPQYGEIVAPEEIDVVFVPLLCFDKKGYRVGYGKGFYDRFLSKCKKECMIIGLSMFDPVDEIEDSNETDFALHYCITPHHFYHFHE